jgi:hypothetical protein
VLDGRKLAAIRMVAYGPWMETAAGTLMDRATGHLCLAMHTLAYRHSVSRSLHKPKDLTVSQRWECLLSCLCLYKKLKTKACLAKKKKEARVYQENKQAVCQSLGTEKR